VSLFLATRWLHFKDFTGSSAPAIDDRKGYRARSSRKEWRKHIHLCFSATEKMLSANQNLSNIFLQRGQNIDIADKKGVLDERNFGS